MPNTRETVHDAQKYVPGHFVCCRMNSNLTMLHKLRQSATYIDKDSISNLNVYLGTQGLKVKKNNTLGFENEAEVGFYGLGKHTNQSGQE